MGQLKKHHRWTISCLVVAALLMTAVATAQAASSKARPRRAANFERLSRFQQQREQYREKFAQELGEIASFCDDTNNAVVADRIRALAAPAETTVLRVQDLSRFVQPELSSLLSDDERKWRSRLRNEQTLYADELYRLSRQVLNAGFPSYAYELVREVVIHNPDHKMARGLFGYIRSGDEWLTPFEAEKKKKNYEWHERFGWLPKSHIARYERGERHYKKWRSAEDEEKLRSDFSRAWEIRTEHFLVKTNYSLERGVEVAKSLEDFHDFFMQTFAQFYNSPEQMKRFFEGSVRKSRRGRRRNVFEVHYYRTQQEYIDRLIAKIPLIAITNGLYYPNDRVAYFFHNPAGGTEDTLYHEATHQLLYESSKKNRLIAQDHHFWIVEGIACYMESFERNNGHFSLGNPNFVRFANARKRFLGLGGLAKYYVPLAEFDSMGMNGFQAAPRLTENYSQAASLAHFFMHAEGGHFRDALIEHLSQMYSTNRSVNNAPQSLSDLIGLDYGDLDRLYGEYVRQLEAQPK